MARQPVRPGDPLPRWTQRGLCPRVPARPRRPCGLGGAADASATPASCRASSTAPTAAVSPSTLTSSSSTGRRACRARSHCRVRCAGISPDGGERLNHVVGHLRHHDVRLFGSRLLPRSCGLRGDGHAHAGSLADRSRSRAAAVHEVARRAARSSGVVVFSLSHGLHPSVALGNDRF